MSLPKELLPFQPGYNVYVPALKAYYTIIGVDDINKILGWDSTENVFKKDATDTLAALANTDYRKVDELNPPTDEFHRIIGIGINARKLHLYVKQPSGVDRLGTSYQAVGELNGKVSPIDNPRPLYNLYVVNNKPPYFKCENKYDGVTVTPQLYVYGYRYKWEELKAKPEQFITITVGGIQ
jgi:hypothetical protein